MGIMDSLSHAWNLFRSKDKPENQKERPIFVNEMTSSSRLDRTPLRLGTERSILAAIYNRIAIDVAAIEIRHARIDENGRFLEEIKSGLNECLAIAANKDQTARAFYMDAVLSMFDEGYIAIVPTDTDIDILRTNAYDILAMRVGRITQWMPNYVRVEVYNDNVGRREEVLLPKDKVCIIENPLYQVMNEPNSTLQRLRHKLALLDATDDKQNSDKLNMIIQLPYQIKSKAKMEAAEERRKEVELQLTQSKYGIAYIDGTEKIIQLGHPIENRLIEQIEYLTNQLYAQLGLTPEVFNGTADERAMLNYINRTIEPIVSAIVDEMHRKFLTKTARTQGQAIVFFRNPFSLVTVENLAEIADKFTRNEILNSNEVRALLGYKPVDTERAEELLNKNINPIPSEQMYPIPPEAGAEVAPTNGLPTIPEMPMPDNVGNNQNANQTESATNDVVDIDSMDEIQMQEYLAKLQAYMDELDEYDNQVNNFSSDEEDDDKKKKEIKHHVFYGSM